MGLHQPAGPRRFAGWLEASMQRRGLSQAELARCVGVADAQVSRWRRGQVVPTVRYLQRIADTFGVERLALDRLVGYPVPEASTRPGQAPDPEREAELQAHQARLREVMAGRLPPSMWPAYVEACTALADALAASHRLTATVRDALGPTPPAATPPPPQPERPLGFRPPAPAPGPRRTP